MRSRFIDVKRTFARLTGLVLLLYGAWMFTISLIEQWCSDSGWRERSAAPYA
ncbi:MAG: hypothetical protein ACRDWS_10845 [Acidimicrobiia bacterium]